MDFVYKVPGLFFSSKLTQEPNLANFQMHTHDQIEIYCFLGGKGIFHVEGSAYELSPGDVLVMKPAESHYVELEANIPYERAVLNLRPELFASIDPDGKLLSAILDRPSGTANRYRDSDFPTGSAHYFRVMCSQEGDPRLNVLCGLVQLLHAIHGLQDTHREQPDSLEYRIVRYVNEHIRSQLTLEDICREFYLSKSQLCRLFRKATATTVRQYITVKRLVYAQALIRQGVSPTQACLQSGFRDYSVFYRAWTKHYGAPPSDHR